MADDDKVFGIPFKETSWGMLYIRAKTKEEALARFENEGDIGDGIEPDYCGDCEVEYNPEEIEER